jgi:hypothetical protein
MDILLGVDVGQEQEVVEGEDDTVWGRGGLGQPQVEGQQNHHDVI